MARKEAILRLHKTLLNRRSELFKRIGGDFEDLGRTRGINASGDTADAAFDAGSEEIASHLAELEARELSQIQRALHRLKAGSYGTCEVCQRKIPVERLNALPYSTMCVKCMRDLESSEFGGGDRFVDWDRVSDSEARMHDRPVDLSRLEMDLSK
jgi:DnaK suppressor protein